MIDQADQEKQHQENEKELRYAEDSSKLRHIISYFGLEELAAKTKLYDHIIREAFSSKSCTALQMFTDKRQTN